jgi:hypothetical protein
VLFFLCSTSFFPEKFTSSVIFLLPELAFYINFFLTHFRIVIAVSCSQLVETAAQLQLFTLLKADYRALPGKSCKHTSVRHLGIF